MRGMSGQARFIAALLFAGWAVGPIGFADEPGGAPAEDAAPGAPAAGPDLATPGHAEPSEEPPAEPGAGASETPHPDPDRADATDDETRALPPDETDDFLDQLFERHKKLERLRAHVTKIKTGGAAFIRPVQKSGPLLAQFPDHLHWDMTESDEPLLIVSDGDYAWIHDPVLEDVERWSLDAYEGERGQFDLAALFLGTDVKTADELRRHFAVTALEEEHLIRLTLLPEDGPAAERYSRIELAFPRDGLLPESARLTGRGDGRKEEKPPVTLYEITDVQTNLDGLPPFPDDQFVFPLGEDMTVSDMSAEGGPRPLSAEEVLRERAEAGAARKEITP